MGLRRIHRQVVALTEAVQRGKLGVVDHQVGRLGEGTIGLVATDAALHWRPRSGAVDNVIPGPAQLCRQLLCEGLVAVGNQDSTHVESSSGLWLETSLPP